MNGSINGFCPIDGTECRRCYGCAVMDKQAPWPNNWLKEITGKWPGDETIEELLAALNDKGVKTP